MYLSFNEAAPFFACAVKTGRLASQVVEVVYVQSRGEKLDGGFDREPAGRLLGYEGRDVWSEGYPDIAIEKILERKPRLCPKTPPSAQDGSEALAGKEAEAGDAVVHRRSRPTPFQRALPPVDAGGVFGESLYPRRHPVDAAAENLSKVRVR